MTEQPTEQGGFAPHRPEDEGAGQPFPESPGKRNDLWHEPKAFDYGLEKNLEIWEEAADVLGSFIEVAAKLGKTKDRLENDALILAMIDAAGRAKEEVRRAHAEIEMRREWAERQPKEAELL